MKETKFIRQNKDKWEKEEKILKDNNAHPDDLSSSFIEITEDLSFARTNYPYRSVRLYLNQQAQKVFLRINRTGFSRKRMVKFWVDELPLAMIEARRDMNLSFMIFLFGLMLGVVSSVYDPDFPRVVMGDAYIDMTLRNIENGDPMGVYKDSGELEMFFSITMNNLRVAFNVFVLGILFSIGSAMILFYNAIMVGTFQFFFFEQAVFKESILAIWLHGSFEISAIIIAGGAGLTLGRGLLFPGTYSRSKAFQLSATRGLKIMLGITPIFVMAAIIESFATRYTDAPDILRLLIILISLSTIFLYYFWYPWRREQQGLAEQKKRTVLAPDQDSEIELESIKSSGQLFSESFVLIQKIGVKAFSKIALFSLLISFFIMYSFEKEEYNLILFGGYLDSLEMILLPNGDALHFLAISLIWIGACYYFVRYFYNSIERPINRRNFRYSMIAIALSSFLFLLPPGLFVLSMLILIVPMIFLISGLLEEEKIDRNRMWRVSSAAFWDNIFLIGLVLVIGFLLFLIISSPLLSYLIDFVSSSVQLSDENYSSFLTFTNIFLHTGLFLSLIYFIFLAFSLKYYANAERSYATKLKAELAGIKRKRMAYGIESEE